MSDAGWQLKPTQSGRQSNRSQRRSRGCLYDATQERIGDRQNPVGGFSTERIALRRAIAMAYKVEDQIRIIRKGQAIRAQFPIPPGVAGHDPHYRSGIPYDPQTANALLDRFGYRRGGDGYRTQPDGTPLVIRYSSLPIERDRQFDELARRSLDSIGIRLEIHGTVSRS
jgi:ABC-type transport system substrate-binding protein